MNPDMLQCLYTIVGLAIFWGGVRLVYFLLREVQ